MKYAFFDVDNTLYHGYTTSDLLTYLKDRSPEHARLLQEVKDGEVDYMLRKVNYNQIAQLTLDNTSKSLEGLKQNEVKEIVLAMLDQKDPVFNDWVGDVVRFLKEEGYKIILVSAGADVLVEEVALMIQADKWFATEMEHKNGIYTGAKTNLLNEHKKTDIVHSILDKGPSEISLGFGDSTGDIPLLENVDHPFVFFNNHHTQMIDFAKTKGWHIFRNASEVINALKKFPS